MNEHEALARAEALARQAAGDVEPNPMVGAVVLADGDAVGEGWHRAFGGPHAEIEALAAAGDRARGATLCVTLEPCSTTGKTGPCTAAVQAAGVRRVVVGSVDPDPRHAGRGIDQLRAEGVDVAVVETSGCAALLERFAAELGSTRPHVLAKWAMSREGAIAPADRSRVTLSGEASWQRVHAWRAAVDAVLVGVGTVLADDPRLTPRGPGPALRPLRRVVLDPSLRTPPGVQLVSTAGETPTWLVATESAEEGRAERLEEHGARVLRVPDGPAWLGDALQTLFLLGVRRLLVEGGARTLTGFLEAGLVDQVAVFLTPETLGPGALDAVEGLPLGGLDPLEVARALRLQDVRVETLGADRLVRGTRSG